MNGTGSSSAPYEPPSVEEVETDGKPIATAPGILTST
jgi:hypothetical protein